MDLIVEVGDTIPYGYGLYLFSEEPFTQFGVSSRKRIFQTVPTTGQQIELVKGFGVVSDSMWQPSHHIGVLKGCIIDGIVYGDTTVVSVGNETTNLPTEFSLSQNYPNPFNPSTKIKFTISDVRFTILKVCDVLGNEIATLINEEKPAGSYEIEFSAKGLPSGVYFYQFKAGSFIQTKKMILLK
ncbi:MAG: T9SS type A sorting domain-containing protein [Gammaproteobacteria bacterium]|nr:T9SS type A sorting domain-containing protein [Gammaproteobacteria bacterium]